MRIVVQRVSSAGVAIDGKSVGKIGAGLLVLLGVGKSDTPADMEWGARKVAEMRIFQDSEHRMNLSVQDVGGSALVISQFTLYGDANKGRRPSFVDAAPPDVAEKLYDEFVQDLRSQGVPTETGVFAARMSVELVNEGPVTILVER